MCGRYFLDSAMDAIEAQFACEAEPTAREQLAPRYNLAPTAVVPVVWSAPAGRVATLHQWGLVPSWSKDPAMGARMANARAETVAEKPAFRGPFRRGRCIIPASGFYEWQARPGGPKQPFAIRAADGTLLAFAGLRDQWESPDGCLETCTIITTAANAVMAPIHDRMPVLLAPGDYAAWLDPAGAPERLRALLRPCPEAFLRVYPVSLRVGNVRNDGPELAEPADA
jgi:putative SOS response-associated peptidase YedK